MTSTVKHPLLVAAVAFLDVCETGQGWEECRRFCTPDATFSSQSETLEDISTLAAYTEWMKGLLTILPDGSYEMKAIGLDEDRKSVSGFGVFQGTHTAEGGPVPPTGKKTKTDYVYVLEFDGDRIHHVTKIWHSGMALKELGWA